MLFSNVVDYLEQLVGIVLTPINPSTSPLIITSVDRSQKKYLLRLESEQKISSRTFRELDEIWQQLALHKYVNVDQALSGVGSSRNQPETILSHFPNVEHFKYLNRKHLLLRSKNTHELGSQKEVTSSDQKILKKLIDHQRMFNVELTRNQLDQNIFKLQESIQQVSSRFPGEPFVFEFNNVLFDLKRLQSEISKTIVSLDVISSEVGATQSFDLKAKDSQMLDLDKLADLSIYTGIDDDDNEDDEPTSDVFQPIFRRQTPTLTLLYDRLFFKEIEMQPAYQRKDRIWPEKLKSKLIESILMGLPLPVFYFGEKPDGNWIVIDGLQRLSTIQDFMLDKFFLKDLEKLESLNGKFFSKLDRTDIRKIKESEITAYVVDASVGSEESVVELFRRINTYGVQLSSQEIRNAMHLGTSVYFLRLLTESQEFKIATDSVVSSKRQKDMELCLGAVAYILNGYQYYGTKSYDEFLRLAMKMLNKEKLVLPDDQGVIDISESSLLVELKKRFSRAVLFAKEIFEDAAFRKNINSNKVEPLSKPLFELLTAIFSSLTLEQMDQVRKSKVNLVDCFYSAIEKDSPAYAQWGSNTFIEAGRGFRYSISQSTGKRITVQYRFSAMIQMIFETTGVQVKMQPMNTEYVNA